MALGKNLKRKKLIPDDPQSKEGEKKPAQGKKTEVKKVHSEKPVGVKKESKKTPKPKQTKIKVTSSGSVKKSTTQKKSAVKVRNEATVPQSQKVKALSEKERKQRQDRRESYVKELALLKNKVTNWIIFDIEGELFAIDIAKTQRVIPTPEISSLPHTASHIKGVAEVNFSCIQGHALTFVNGNCPG